MGKMLTPRKEKSRDKDERPQRKLSKRKNTESESKDSEERATKKRKLDVAPKGRLLSPVPASPLVRACGVYELPSPD